MPLVLAFVAIAGAALLLTSAIADASFADVIKGQAGALYRQHQAAAPAAPAAAPSSTPSPSTSPSSTTTPTLPAGGNPVVKAAGAILMAHGLTRTAAAGVLGNAYGESNWTPSSVGSGGGGLWGFTSSPMSLADLQAYAAAHGVAWTNVAIQTEFLLAHLSQSDIQALNAQPTPQAAAAWFQNNWERPASATASLAKRETAAAQAYGML